MHTALIFNWFKKKIYILQIKEINIRKTFLIPLLPTAKLRCVMSAWNALLVAFFLINIEVLIVFPLHGQTPSFCLPGLRTRTSTIPCLLLRNKDRHANVTTSLGLVMKEILTLSLSYQPCLTTCLSLSLWVMIQEVSVRGLQKLLETAEGTAKEVCSGMSGWRRWKRGNHSLSSPEELEGMKWKQVTKLKRTKGDTFPQYVIELWVPTMGSAKCIPCFNKKLQNGNTRRRLSEEFK